MPKSTLNWKTRRALTENAKAQPGEFFSAGRELMAADMLAEAADLMARAGDAEGLGLLRARAVEEGNFFLYQMAVRLQKAEPEGGELEALADRAASLGLAAYENSARKLLAERKPR
ncbi:MAG: hypothetical protein LBF58_07165 [Deltaproteobacteria bacterium]|jgi:hypothetical protein|nr:hypothetical protein [Deltaproteobacteria bacterium]